MMYTPNSITKALLLASAVMMSACQSTQPTTQTPQPPMPPSNSPSPSTPTQNPSMPSSQPTMPTATTSSMPTSSSQSRSDQSARTDSGNPSDQTNSGENGENSSGTGQEQQGASDSSVGNEEIAGGSNDAAPNDPMEQSSSESGSNQESEAVEVATNSQSQSQSDEIDFSEEDPSSASSASAQTAASSSSSSSSASSSSSSSSSSSASASASSSASAAGGSTGGAQTVDERIAEMEGELDTSMGEYDGMILAEREYIQNRENQKGSEEEVAQVDRGAIFDEADIVTGEIKEGSPNQTAGGPRNQTSGTDDSDYGGMTATARTGDYQHGGTKSSFPPPADIPSGHDDDVVARQIREAAMREPDAALREKLWEEYRKYKNQSSED